IRDYKVTGVQTCALPIYGRRTHTATPRAPARWASIVSAADLMNIDLLITADTMLAHLAGALGVAVWVLLPFAADWRWMLDRADKIGRASCRDRALLAGRR